MASYGKQKGQLENNINTLANYAIQNSNKENST